MPSANEACLISGEGHETILGRAFRWSKTLRSFEGDARKDDPKRGHSWLPLFGIANIRRPPPRAGWTLVPGGGVDPPRQQVPADFATRPCIQVKSGTPHARVSCCTARVALGYYAKSKRHRIFSWSHARTERFDEKLCVCFPCDLPVDLRHSRPGAIHPSTVPRPQASGHRRISRRNHNRRIPLAGKLGRSRSEAVERGRKRPRSPVSGQPAGSPR